jgi:murein DD-endopeptidase MepM/ murein hydrolase activator NlpD
MAAARAVVPNSGVLHAAQWAKKGEGRSVWLARMSDGTERALVRYVYRGQECVYDPVLKNGYAIGEYPKYSKLLIMSWHPQYAGKASPPAQGEALEVITAHIPPWGVFGAPRRNGEQDRRYAHTGVDIYAPEGTNLLAAGRGRISKVLYEHPRAGDYVDLQVTGAAGDFYFRYLHCRDIFVGENEDVAQGAVIASVGMSGNANQARPWVTRGNGELARSHVHFEARERGGNGEALDPVALLVEGKMGIPIDVGKMI